MDEMGKFAPFLVTVVCALLGQWILISSWKAYFINQQSLHWPTVSGTIITSREIQRPGNVSDQMRHEAQRESWEQTHTTDSIAQIVYTYTVGGQIYQGWAIGSFATLNVTQALLQKYPAGKEVAVSYNPHNPQQCVVEPTGTANLMSVLLGTTIGLLFEGIAVIPAVYLFAPTTFEAWLKTAQELLGGY